MINYIRAKLDDLANVVRGITSFIGSLWSRIYKYVGSQIKDLIRHARDLAQSAYNSAIGYVNAFIGSIYSRITKVFNDAKRFAIQIVAAAVTSAKNFAKSLINGAQRLAERAIALVNNGLNFFGGQISAIVADVVTIYRWIRDRGDGVYNIVKDWLRVFTPDNLSRFVYLVVNLFPSLFNFFNHPVEHIVVWLEPLLIDMIMWLLAYEMGAKNRTLPSKPSKYG